jgi:AraC-like DNA-binding protein
MNPSAFPPPGRPRPHRNHVSSACSDQGIFQLLAREPVVREYIAAFRRATGLSLTLLPAGGPPRPWASSRKQNPFCALVGGSAGGRVACAEIWTALQRRLRRRLAPQRIRCFAGMTEIAVPVVVGGSHAATWLAGKVCLRESGRRRFERHARRTLAWQEDGDSCRWKRAYSGTPVVREKEFNAAVRLLEIFARQLAEHANGRLIAVRRSDPAPVARAKTFVHAHAGGKVRLVDVAAHVHLSPHHFCKVFKKAARVTFMEYLARVRVEHAKRLLADRLLQVTGVADRAGFGSISQFNRVFRRYTGASPSGFRAALRSGTS